MYFFYTYLPVQDAWAHAYTIFSFLQINTPPWKDLLLINYRPYATWFPDAVLFPFVWIFGYQTGLIIFFVFLTMLVMLSSYRYFRLWANHKYALMFSLIIGINVFLLKGFFAYNIGLVILLFLITELVKKRNSKLWIILVISEFFVHPFYFAESILMGFWNFVVKYLKRIKRERFKYYFLPLVVLSVVLIIIRLIPYGDIPFSWEVSFTERIKLLIKGGYILPWHKLFRKDNWLVFYLIPFTTVLFVYSIKTGIEYIKEHSSRSDERKILILTGLTNAVLFFTIFDVIKTGSYIHTRQAFMSFVLLVPVFLKKWEAGKVMNAITLIYIFSLFCIEVLISIQRFNRFDTRFNYAVKTASDFIPSGKIFYSFTRFLPEGGYVYPGVHIGGAMGIKRKSLYVNNIDFLGTYHPLKIKNADSYRNINSCNCKKMVEIPLDYIFVYTDNKRAIDSFSACFCEGMWTTVFKNDSVFILKRTVPYQKNYE